MELRVGYKQTEVGVIPEDWEVSKITDLATMKSGTGITAGSIDNHSQFPCYGGNGLRGFTKQYTHDGSYALVGRQGALCGNVTLVRGKFFASEHAVVVTPRILTDIRWLSVVLAEMRLGQYAESSAQPGLSVAKILKLQLAHPLDESEQRAIADALSDADALIASLDGLIAKKRDLKRATMQQLITGKTRLPGFAGEWELKRFGEVLKVRHGKSQKGVEVADGAYPILATGGEIGRTDAFLYDKPSVLIGRKGTIDFPQFIDTPFWTIDTLFFTEISATAIPKFIFYRFLLIDWRAYNEASGVPSLSSATIEKIEFACPGPAEQSAIATVLSDMDEELSALEVRREKARALKQGMMQELLMGRIRLV